MSSNDRRICEYFLISGFSNTRKVYDLSQIFYQGEEIVNADVKITEDFFHYKEPVVDIQIVNGNSINKLPDGYHVVQNTYSNQHRADLYGKSAVDELFLCFRYGRDKPPITDIWAFYMKQKNPCTQDQWTLIEKTFNGHSANLSSSSSNPLYIAFKRAHANAPVDNLAVTDICIILSNKNELCPPAYSRVDIPIKRSPLGHTINICYKKSMVKQNVLSFQPEIIYCLPATSAEPIVDIYNPDRDSVKSESCLPEDIYDVANFCMPWGATLESWSVDRCIPKPSFLTFVLTNVNYNRMYGAAVLFYEEIDEDELTKEEIAYFHAKNGAQTNEPFKIFCSRSLCLLSRWPLFQTFNRVLSFIIQEDVKQRSTNPANSIPIETFISQFLHTVAFPTPQAPNILLQWDHDHPIGIQLPTDALSRFGTGENFYHLIRMLDVEQIIQLFVYMLTEQKILLTSTCNSDLTGIAEALIAMIFPFKWSVVYIPFLYLRCIHIIQSPSPYLIGVDSRFFDFFRLPEGVGCIDLITKSIKPPETNCKYLDYMKVLPKSVLKSLRNGLNNCKTKVISFEKQQILRKNTGNVMDEFTILRKRENIGESIRECFLRAVILMFRNYQSYLIPVSFSQTKDIMFDIDGFLKSVDRNCRVLYQAIFDTQLWSNFILERSYATEFDDGLAFFDRCIKYMRDMNDETANAASLLQTDSVIKSEHTKVLDPPDPIITKPSNSPRRTFPKRLCSDLMLPSIHITPNNFDDSGEDNNLTDLNYTTPPPINSEKHLENGSTVSLTTPDSSIPVLLITPESTMNVSSNIRNRRPVKVSMLKRPFEELKQARLMGKEARYGHSYAWAAHLLSSSYCLWFLSLPGLIGYVEETAGLKETGLAERILQLALMLLDTMNVNRLSLPDEVCYRVLLILIHQLRPIRLHVSELLKHADLNAFSYGLCNQIILEQEQQWSQKMSNLSTSTKQGKGDSDNSDKLIVIEKEVKDEKDCDSGRETLVSANIAPEESLDSCDSGCNLIMKSDNNYSIEIGGKPVQLRGRYQTPRNHKDRVSQLIITSPVDLYSSNDVEKNRQFFDPKAGIIMSTADRSLSPFLKMYQSPKSNEEIDKPKVIPPIDSTTTAIITRTPFSEERSELHASFLMKKRSSIDTNSTTSEKVQSEIAANVISNPLEIAPYSDISSDLSRSRISDSRLIQSEFSSDKVTNKTRASFRQIKNAANKSIRSMRNIVSTMGSGSWLTPLDGKFTPDSNQKALPAGLPNAFRPWNQNSSHSNGMNTENRLKATASADLLDTLGNDHVKIHENKVCANTVQQLRRNTNLSGTHWTKSESCESFSSDKFDQDSSTNSLDTEPPYLFIDKFYDKITGSLGAIRLPTGKYWPDNQVDGDYPAPCIECTQSIYVHMTTCSQCVKCLQLVYDDDIMSGWSYNDSDLQSLCPYCNDSNSTNSNSTSYRFTPKLNFLVYISHPDPQTGKPGSQSLAYSSIVNYLSPFVLRKELESVLDQEGEVALLKSEFLYKHGILYWNLLWYYSRLGLPTHLLSFLTIWLKEKGEMLSAASEKNKNKYEILVNLTGFEQVIVILFWEFAPPHSPLYRCIHNPASLEHFGASVKSRINEALAAIVNNNLSDAVEALIMIRMERGENSAIMSRSIYRELYCLITVALGTQVNYDVFNFSYNEPWQSLRKEYQAYVKNHDNPPSEQSLFCRKFFRPLQLI